MNVETMGRFITIYFWLIGAFGPALFVQSNDLETTQIHRYKERVMMMSGTTTTDVRDACDGADRKKAFYVVADGSLYCVFIPATSAEFHAQEKNFDIDASRMLCNRSDANLLQIHSSVMYKGIKQWAEQQSANGSQTFHPLGIQEYTYFYEDAEPESADDFEALDVEVTWDNGQITKFNTENLFGEKLPLWLDADVDGITYLALLTGSFLTEEPETTTITVSILCHQDPDYPVTTDPEDICGGMDPNITAYEKFYVAGKSHCIFHPPVKDALLMKNEDDQYDFDIYEFKNACKERNASLLQIPTVELYKAVLEAARTLDHSPGIAYPLGIKKKVILNEEEAPDPATMIVVAWDNDDETVVVDSIVHEQAQWNYLNGNTSFLSLPSGHFYTQVPSAIKGPIQVMCQQQWQLVERQIPTTTVATETTGGQPPTPPVQTPAPTVGPKPPEPTAGPPPETTTSGGGCKMGRNAGFIVPVIAATIAATSVVP